MKPDDIEAFAKGAMFGFEAVETFFTSKTEEEAAAKVTEIMVRYDVKGEIFNRLERKMQDIAAARMVRYRGGD